MFARKHLKEALWNDEFKNNLKDNRKMGREKKKKRQKRETAGDVKHTTLSI